MWVPCLLAINVFLSIKYYGTEMQQGILWVESIGLMFVWFMDMGDTDFSIYLQWKAVSMRRCTFLP